MKKLTRDRVVPIISASVSWLIFAIGLFRSRASLEAEILALHHQLVLRTKAPKRLAFNSFDRLFFASLYRIAPGVVNALVIVKRRLSSGGIVPVFA